MPILLLCPSLPHCERMEFEVTHEIRTVYPQVSYLFVIAKT